MMLAGGKANDDCPVCKGHGHVIHKVKGEDQESPCGACGGSGDLSDVKWTEGPNPRPIIDAAVDAIGAALDAAKLTKKTEKAKMPTQVSDSNTNEGDSEMATKKKTASKKKTSTPKEKKVKTAAPIGRERKLLLRLSKDEYATLQAKAEKQGTSMANLLRTAAIG